MKVDDTIPHFVLTISVYLGFCFRETTGETKSIGVQILFQATPTIILCHLRLQVEPNISGNITHLIVYPCVPGKKCFLEYLIISFGFFRTSAGHRKAFSGHPLHPRELRCGSHHGGPFFFGGGGGAGRWCGSGLGI